MAKASRSYRLPPFVAQVLSKKEKDKRVVCSCIDQLVYANEYLTSKPSNDIGERLHERTSANLQAVAAIADDLIMSAFVQAVTGSWFGAGDFRTPMKPSTTMKTAAKSSLASAMHAGVFRNRDALRDVEVLVKKVYQTFDSKRIVEVDVKQLLVERVDAAVDSMFDATYFEENEGVRDFSSTHINLAAVTKHYQRGDHRLLKISEACRSIVSEVSEVYHDTVIVPLDDDYDVVKIPSEIASRVFRAVVRRAVVTCTFDLSANGDPTRMFVASRGAGIGLCPANHFRYFRDQMFIALDLVPELWAWKTLAGTISGDAADFVDEVEESLEDFLDRARNPLDLYADAKGEVKLEMLLKLTMEMSSADWIPAFDCTAHESSTNLLYLLKVLYSDHLGAVKLVLHGGRLSDADDDHAALDELEEFTRRCVDGTIEDLKTIARAAIVLQKEESRRPTLKNLASFASKGIRGVQGSARCAVDEHVFLLNNVTYLLEHFQSDECFLAVCRPLAQSGDGQGAGAAKGPQQEAIVASIVAALEALRDECVEQYCDSWSAAFPPLDAEWEAIIEVCHEEDAALSKEQRLAVKHWYGAASAMLRQRIDEGCVLVVMDPRARNELIEGAIRVVEEKLTEVDDIIGDKEWSRRPLKWRTRVTCEWAEELQKMF